MSKKKEDYDRDTDQPERLKTPDELAQQAMQEGGVFTNQGNDSKYEFEHVEDPEAKARNELIEAAQASLPDNDPNKTRPAREIDDTPPPTEGEEQRAAAEEARMAAKKAAKEQEATMDKVDAKREAERDDDDDDDEEGSKRGKHDHKRK
jgi:hypothetical protein